LACWEIFDIAKSAGEVTEAIYTDDECEKLKEQVEILREDQYLEDVYGVQSKLDNEPWLAKNAKEANWVFNTVSLRKRLFEAAEIEMRHFNASVIP